MALHFLRRRIDIQALSQTIEFLSRELLLHRAGSTSGAGTGDDSPSAGVKFELPPGAQYELGTDLERRFRRPYLSSSFHQSYNRLCDRKGKVESYDLLGLSNDRCWKPLEQSQSVDRITDAVPLFDVYVSSSRSSS